MVDPGRRRQGIASLLYEAACAEIAGRGGGTVLLVVDRTYAPGAEFAEVFGGTLDHSEHRMVQVREPALVPASVADVISVREAGAGDVGFVSACLAAAFDEPVGPVDESDADAVRRHVTGTLVISTSDVPVGVMRVERDGKDAGIYGFAVAPEFQGRGYGRAALSSVTSGLRAEGVTVALEVLSTNDHALNLYLSCGFESRGTEDYYAMPMTAS
jgi:ribosomal protein S18 acetylase RimI-like enzyme